MKVKLDETTFLTSGLMLAKENKYVDALKMFNKCNSYEGKINKVLTLFALQEHMYGSESYFKLYSEYGLTHNVYFDIIENLGEFKDGLKLFNGSSADKKRKKSKVSADSNLLIKFFVDVDCDFDFDLSMDDLKSGGFSWFVDVKSDDYQDLLLCNADPRLVENKKQLQNAKNKVLEQNTDYLPTNLYKLIEFLRQKAFDKALNVACEMFDRDDLEFYHMFFIAETLIIHGGQDKLDKTKNILERIYCKRDELDAPELEDAMIFAFNFLEEKQLAEKFADALISAYDCKFEQLKGCLQVFLNAGKLERVREILLELCNAFPDDLYANATLDFLNSHGSFDGYNLFQKIPDKFFRHFNIPETVVIGIFNELLKRVEDAADFKFNEKNISDLNVVLYKLPSLMWEDSSRKLYDILFEGAASILKCGKINSDSIAKFVLMTKNYCCQTGCEPYLCALMLNAVLPFRLETKFFIRNSYVSYFFDLSLLADFSGNERKSLIFARLAILAELNQSNLAEYSESYDFLENQHKEMLDAASDMQVIYFIYGRTMPAKRLLKSKFHSKENAELLVKLNSK